MPIPVPENTPAPTAPLTPELHFPAIVATVLVFVAKPKLGSVREMPQTPNLSLGHHNSTSILA
jgi:hypothetical protein